MSDKTRKSECKVTIKHSQIVGDSVVTLQTIVIQKKKGQYQHSVFVLHDRLKLVEIVNSPLPPS